WFSELMDSNVPGFAILCATSHVRHLENSAFFKIGQPRGAEGGIDGDTVSTVTFEPDRVRSIERQSFLVNDGKRNHGAISALGLNFFRFNLRKINRRWRH